MTEQAMRKNEGKAKLSYVLELGPALEGVSSVLERGAVKYSRGNYHKGFPHTELVNSLMRHLLAYMGGEDTDPESGNLHVDHISTNALFLSLNVRTHPEYEDRSEELLRGSSKDTST